MPARPDGPGFRLAASGRDRPHCTQDDSPPRPPTSHHDPYLTCHPLEAPSGRCFAFQGRGGGFTSCHPHALACTVVTSGSPHIQVLFCSQEIIQSEGYTPSAPQRTLPHIWGLQSAGQIPAWGPERDEPASDGLADGQPALGVDSRLSPGPVRCRAGDAEGSALTLGLGLGDGRGGGGVGGDGGC